MIYFHKFIEEPDRFCLVFEKVDGGDLFECIKVRYVCLDGVYVCWSEVTFWDGRSYHVSSRFVSCQGLTTFTERQASLVIRDVTRGLAFLHAKGRLAWATKPG